jgi:prolipoprotein diacylglyceryl transferase
MFPTIQVGPLNIQAPGLILIISLWVGLNLAEKFAKRRGFQADRLYNLIFISLVAGILGARLFFILGNLNSFTGNFINIFSLNPGLLDPFGGLAAASLAAYIYSQKNKLPLWETLDALTPLFAVMMIGVGISHLSSGNAYGTETSMPWGLNLWGAKRHPSQVYEIIASVITLAILWQDFSKVKNPGLIFLKFTMMTSIWFIFIEGYRGDSQILAAGIRSGQIVALLILAIGFYLYEKKLSKIVPMDKGEAQNG